MKRSAAVVLLFVTAACGGGSHATAVLQAEPSAAAPTTPTASLPPLPELSPTPAVTHTTAPALPKPTASPTRRATASPTPADTRPRATVVVVNHASMTVDGVVGDVTFHLTSGASSTRESVHVDPGGNTGVGARRSDDATCGWGSPKLMQAGQAYTLTLVDGGTCTSQGTEKPAPTGALTRS